MDLRATPNLVHLSEAGRRSLQLEEGKGFRIVAVSGQVWVTQTGFIEDYILSPGDALTLDSPGPAVVTSFGPADIEVVAPSVARRLDPPTISGEAIEWAQAEARRLRAEALREMFDTAAAWFSSLARGLGLAVTTSRAARGTRQHC